MKTLIGIVTFGNLEFTKLALRGIAETIHREVQFLVIVGKPDDLATVEYCASQGISTLRHDKNMGFPYSINDLYEIAFAAEFEALIVMGNDVIPYPNAIETMIDVAENTAYEWLCACQFDARSLIARYPEAARYFTGENLVFRDFGVRPWYLHWPAALKEMERLPIIGAEAISDVRNLCLFKRSVFDKLGFADANFWPGGYFEDNDYCRRGRLAGIRACTLPHAAYFHFWSRTIHQEGGSTTPQFFARNQAFYRTKWGGDFDAETFALPFNGDPYALGSGEDQVILPASVKIAKRNNDGRIARYWRNLGL